MSTDELLLITTLSHKGAEEDTPFSPLNRAVADLARAYVEEMRDDVSERDGEHVSTIDYVTDAGETETETVVTAKDVAKEEFSKLSIPFPESILEQESNVSAEELVSFPSKRISTALSKASSASMSQLDPSVASNPPVTDVIISRFESIMVSETNDISELGTIIEARGVISTLFNLSESGCCMMPPSSLRGARRCVSPFRGERTCASRFDDIDEMSCADDEEVEELVPYDVVVGDEESVVKTSGLDLVAKSTETAFAENTGVATTEGAEDASSGISNGSDVVGKDESEPYVQVKDTSVEEDHKGCESAMFHDAVEEDVDEAESPAVETGASADNSNVEEVKTESGGSTVTEDETAATIKTDHVEQEQADSDNAAEEVTTFGEKEVASISAQEDVESETIEMKKDKPVAPSQDVGQPNEEDTVVPEVDETDNTFTVQDIAEPTTPSASSEKEEVVSDDKAAEIAAEDGSAEAKDAVEQSGGLSIDTSQDSSLGSVWKLAADRAKAECARQQHYGSPRLQNDSSLTEITSNRLQTPRETDKKVHWSLSLDALSSDAELPTSVKSTSWASASADSSRRSPSPVGKSASWPSSVDSSRRSPSPVVEESVSLASNAENSCRSAPPVVKAPGMIESCNFDLKVGCSGPVADTTSRFFAKMRSDWKYAECSSFSELKTDLLSWTESGACSKDTTVQSPVHQTKEEVCGTKEDLQEHDSAHDERGNTAAIADSRPTHDMKSGRYTETIKATKLFFMQVGSELKGDGPIVSSLASQMSNYSCVNPASRAEKANTMDSSSTAKVSPPHESTNITGTTSGQREVPLETAVLSIQTSTTEWVDENHGSSELKSDGMKLAVQVVTSPNHLHEAVYREREYLREWKLDAEETMQCQDAVTGVLREQKLTLVKQVSELEGAVKDLKEWNYNALEKIKVQTAGLEQLESQKTELLKQCDEHKESIKELTQWKSDAEESRAAQDEALKLAKEEKSTLAQALADKSAELESALHSNKNFVRQCKEYQETIQDLTAWKADAGISMEDHVAEMKQLREENTALSTQCSNQEKSLEEIKEWNIKAEESMSNHLNELVLLKEQNVELTKKCSQYQVSVDDLTKWKSTADETIDTQINTIEKLTQWKIEAEELMKAQTRKLGSLNDKNSELARQLDMNEQIIWELTSSKANAENEIKGLVAEIDGLKAEAEMAVCCNVEERASLEELTKWKAETEKTMKNKEAEVNELQAHYLIFGRQCNEQKELIEEKDLELQRLTEELKEATETVASQKNKVNALSNKLESYKEVIQLKQSEVSGLKAKVFKLTETNKQLTESRDKPYKDEMIAMKLAHHKELMVLKTERHQLASKIESLVCKNEETKCRVTSLRGDMEDLENQLREEKKRHSESKMAIEKLEKALKAADKQHKQLIASEKIILSQRLSEGL